MPNGCARVDVGPSRFSPARRFAILWAVAASVLQTQAVAAAGFQLEDAVLDAITAQAGSQALASGGAFNAMVSPAPILVVAPLGVGVTGSPASVVGSLVIPNPSPLTAAPSSFPGLDTTQIGASAEAKASGEAARTSSATSSGIVPSSAALAGSAIAELAAFSGSSRVLPAAGSASGGISGSVEATVATTAEALARGRFGTTGVTLDFANVGTSSAKQGAESGTQQRLRATASDSLVTAHAVFSVTSCCNEIVRQPMVDATAGGPYTLKTGWSYFAVDGPRTTIFGSVFVLATDLRITPSIADYSLRLQGITFGR